MKKRKKGERKFRQKLPPPKKRVSRVHLRSLRPKPITLPSPSLSLSLSPTLIHKRNYHFSPSYPPPPPPSPPPLPFPRPPPSRVLRAVIKTRDIHVKPGVKPAAKSSSRDWALNNAKRILWRRPLHHRGGGNNDDSSSVKGARVFDS